MYTIEIDELDDGRNTTWTAEIFAGKKRVGWVEARRYEDEAFTVANMEHSWLDDEHQGKGLGMEAYELLFARLKECGIKTIAGLTHSSSAARVHQRLAFKYGYEYPYLHDDASGGHPYDETFGPYRYALK